MDNKESENFFKQMRIEEITKLTDVGFTEEQAKVLVEMIEMKAMSGGIF